MAFLASVLHSEALLTAPRATNTERVPTSLTASNLTFGPWTVPIVCARFAE